MSDQADGLRELVAHDKLGPRIYVIPDVDRLTAAKTHALKNMAANMGVRIFDLGQGTDVFFDPKPTIDKATLWDALKSDLEREADSHYQDQANKWHGDANKASIARVTLDRMLQMEIFATHAKRVDAETFARVRDELGGGR